MRKCRLRLHWLGHYLSQMGKAEKVIMAGGCQFTQYHTQDLKQFMELGHAFKPFEPEELYKTLPDRFVAVNKITLPGIDECPPFIAYMAPPPKFVKTRESRRQECAREYGRHWKEVVLEIRNKRLYYQKADERWHSSIQEAIDEEKSSKQGLKLDNK